MRPFKYIAFSYRRAASGPSCRQQRDRSDRSGAGMKIMKRVKKNNPGRNGRHHTGDPPLPRSVCSLGSGVGVNILKRVKTAMCVLIRVA